MITRTMGIRAMLAGLLILCLPMCLLAQNDAAKENYDLKNGNSTQHVHKDYVDKILTQKMTLLKQYLKQLAEKKGNDYHATLEKAMGLFNKDETVMVTITNKNSGRVYVKPIREYLTDVYRLPYKAISITYRNYTQIENIKKQPDGTFKGVAVLQQEFSGYDKEGNAMYHDVIKRNIEVNVKIYDYYKPGDKIDLVAVDVFFGNMGVIEN